jgi:Protein of unknown function (DUF2794)
MGRRAGVVWAPAARQGRRCSAADAERRLGRAPVGAALTPPDRARRAHGRSGGINPISIADLCILAKSAKPRHARTMTPPEIARIAALPDRVSFSRTELGTILGLYGRMVAAGLWRDYGIAMLRDAAVFSVFRHTAEHPLYRIEKRPKLAGRQGQFMVIGMDGRILRRGHDLAQVLRVLEAKLIRVV